MPRWTHLRAWLLSFLAALSCGTALARGVSPYLPLNLDPEMERQIEQVLVLADRPYLTRPIAAAVVWDALPAACARDEALCRSVERYLGRYMQRAGVTDLSISGAVTDGAERPIPNRHGLATDSAWETSARVYWQPFDHALLALGGVAYDGEATPTGSLLSLGWSFAQLDAGFRDHWLSPFADSAMLLSTEAPTMPSVTVSNYVPLTRLGLRYEAFLAEMSTSDRILFEGGYTSGHPRLAGMSLSIEPASGWSLGFNRIMQFGGGARGGSSLGDVLDAFFNPSGHDNVSNAGEPQFGNQAASFTSRFVFPGAVPFSVYAEYAGEDTSRGRNYLLGNSSLSLGIDFPQLWRRFDLTLEASEWQNGWYVHGVYQDGLVNERRVIGHWGADQREPGDGVGARSAMARLGWQPAFGGQFALRGRVIENASYSAVDYTRGYDLTLSYARPVGDFSVGGEVYAGRDVFGEDFSRIAAFVRYAPGAAGSAHGVAPIEPAARQRADGAELFVDIGANINEVRIDLDDNLPRTTTDREAAPHFGLGARRSVTAHQDLGARIEYDDIDGHALLGVRALDYRYRFAGPIALTGFIGAARYDLATPAYGVYLGAGAQWRDLLPRLDLSLDLRYASKVARDDLVAGDPVGGRPDSFYDIASAALYFSYRF
ncbi:MAG: capsule assembly Wzi family protein [Steroidobacteraceae bacterium]